MGNNVNINFKSNQTCKIDFEPIWFSNKILVNNMNFKIYNYSDNLKLINYLLLYENLLKRQKIQSMERS